MRASIRLGRIAGIDIGVHYSWFAVMALVSWSLAEQLFPREFAGWSQVTYWATGVVVALMLFASVLVHELAHSMVALARGFRVDGITLFILGGVSNLRAEARHPRDEFAISVVGPLTSVLLAGLLGLVLLAFREDVEPYASVWFLGEVTVDNSPAAALVWYLAQINLVLAAFNLVPAFPLDGGRVLRSILWGLTGSFRKATSVATRGGQAFGLLAIGLGALLVVGAGNLGGLWLALIGWFLHSAAIGARHEPRSRSGLVRVKVREAMDAHPATIGPEATISDAVFEHFVGRRARTLPVFEGPTLVGIITLSDISVVPRELWGSARVGDRMTPAPLVHVSPDDDVSYVVGLLARHGINQAPVLEGGRLVGLVSSAHAIMALQSRGELLVG